MGADYKGLAEVLLMSTNNICGKWSNKKNILFCWGKEKRHLTGTMQSLALWVTFSADDSFEIFFLFFPENRI